MRVLYYMEMGGFVTTDNVSWSDIVTMSLQLTLSVVGCHKM